MNSSDERVTDNCSVPDASACDGDVHVASLFAVHDVLLATRASFLVSIIDEPRLVPTPHWIEPHNHLRIACEDVVDAARALQPPVARQIEALIGYVSGWGRRGPLVIHCRAGVSRSTAAAFVTLCTVNPAIDEASHARSLMNASPTAAPNRLIVTLADTLLGRDGRMTAALACFEDAEPATGPARPFRLATSA